MVSRITCQVHDGAHVTVVRLAGTLDMISMREVYAHLERCLARQPDALVVDLAELAVHDQLAVSVFAAAARHAADWPAVPLVLCAPHPEAAALLAGCRELVADACARWNLPDAVGPASVVLSELVGNVVRHAGTPMQVTVTLRRPWLHLAVVDGAAARPGPAGQRDEGGRGLLLVRELADRWGSAPAGDGKAVWATLPAN